MVQGLSFHSAEVSIPIGFSHQLRHYMRSMGGLDGAVSIPIGFSHQLRLCDRSRAPVHGSFNPYRVFSSAETVVLDTRVEILAEVSIPIGFSHQLRPRWRLCT